MCPSNTRRQPVILTKEEIEKVANDDRNLLMGNFKDGEYDGPDVLKYGSDPNKPFYYMCPRYWCLLTNKPLTSQQVENGECGGKNAIIPKNVKKVPKGKSIYEFYDDKHKRFPGFHKEQTPNGQCIPCCYDNWNKPAQISRRAKCSGEINESEQKNVDFDSYIKGPDKFPLGDKRWGYLPFPIQIFFNELSIDCQISKTNTNIKPFHNCLLRHGIENSENQSFIACISNALFYGEKNDENGKSKITKFVPDAKYDVPSITIMKQLLLNAIDIDKFITYQNGDLLTSFANSSLQVNESLYFNSKLYKKINTSNKNTNTKYSLDFFKKTVQAFENFKLFILNPTVVIDYTYLWDIICKPNSMLFEKGINLIILEILDNDITNNIELVCPTNHYSNNVYDEKKPSLILIKHNQYFEPIYSYKNEEKRIFIIKTFLEVDPNLSLSVRNIFRKIIRPIMKEKCKPFLSMPNVYKFKSPLLLDDLILDLNKRNYEIIKQVLNFQGKVIGLICKDYKGNEGFIPCYPSSLTDLTKCYNKNDSKNDNECNYDYVYMNDNIWKSYSDTISFLKEYYNYQEPKVKDTETSKNKYKCMDGIDICKVIEDKMIIGFLTKTNQFVQISPPIPESDASDNIRKITNNNYLVADIETLANNKVDLERVDYIKRIELETIFYNVFRNTIRILLNDYTNSEKRKVIQDLCDQKIVMYNSQLEEVKKLLRNLCEGSIIFATKEQGFNYLDMKDITACISLSSDKTKCNDKKPVCMFTKDKCSIILPKNNLLSNKDNEDFYFGKMADELIRYNRIKSFIFKPQSYLSFGQLKYNLKDNEIIILQTLLNNEYFENLIPADINEYAKFNTFDSAEPIISQAFTNEVNINDLINDNTNNNNTNNNNTNNNNTNNNNTNNTINCKTSKPNKITSKIWSECFPDDFKEIEYKSNDNKCTIRLIIDIIKLFKETDYSVNEIKNFLLEEYRKYTFNFEKSYIDKVADILMEEGKIEDGNKLKHNEIGMMQMIFSESYYFTNFDLWLLLNRLEIPSIFISNFHIPETRFTTNTFICFTNNNSNSIKDYVFIGIGLPKENILPNFKLLTNNEGKISISLDQIKNENCKSKIENALNNYVSIERYIDVFQKNIKKKNIQKKKINPVELEIVEELGPEPQPKELELELEPEIIQIEVPEKSKKKSLNKTKKNIKTLGI